MNEDIMCYITYAVPKNKLPQFFGLEQKEESYEEVYPAEFVPEWYRNSSFPEDDL